jgi:hypothetical protein
MQLINQKNKAFALSIILISVATQLRAQCPTLVWSDEFDSTALNLNKWSYQLGGNGWGNSELQNYTDRNAEVSNGTLKIKFLLWRQIRRIRS